MFRQSLQEFKSVKTVAICGMMGALAIVLNYVATIKIGDYIRIGFSFTPNLIVDFLFGPAAGAVFGGVMDIVKYMLVPTGTFFPGFTLSAMVGAAIYGVILYRRRISWARIALAQFLVKLFVNIGLNSLWLLILNGQGLWAMLPGRILSNAIMLPIDIVISYGVLTLIARFVPRQTDAAV